MRHHLATVASGLLAATAFALSWAWAQGVVVTVAAFCVSLVAIVSAVRTLSGLRPVRWLWHQLIGEPVDEAFERRVLRALNTWWNDPEGPSKRLERLERAADRITTPPEQ